MRNKEQQNTQARLITLQQASREFGPPYNSLRDLVLNGHLPGIRFGDGRRIWVKRTDLEQLIANSTETAGR
jgi:hypothetical protein